jgi:hypothetical protein
MNTETVFEQTRASFEAHGFQMIDIMEYLHNASAAGQLDLVTAITGHMRDIHQELEVGDEVTYASLFLSAYRRAWFDEEHAAKYGTQRFLELALDTRLRLIMGMADVFAQTSQGNGAQIAQTLSACTSHAH